MTSLARHDGSMTENNDTTPSISPDDPRYGYAVVTSALHPVIAEAINHLDKPTPCSEFNVKDLLNHMVMVQQRSAAIGAGRHWSEVQDPGLDSGWPEAFQSASHDVQKAWTDDARLGAMVEVPWGHIPGAAMLATYTAELAVHGWELSTATDQSFTIADEHLAGAHQAVLFIPAEGRETPEIPFDPVVVPLEGAPLLLKIAGWMGRQVVTEV